MHVISAVIEFFSALPTIIRMTHSFLKWAKKASKKNPKMMAKNISLVFDHLNNAQTKEDRENAAQQLFSLILNDQFEITVYISDPDIGGMEFFDPKSGSKGFVHYSMTENFICFKQSDAEILMKQYKNSH